MKSKITFVKNFTRDTTLVIQELWFKKLQEMIGVCVQNYAAKFPVIGVDFVSDGVVEIWENEAAVDYLTNCLVKKSFKQTGAILKELSVYEQEIEKMKKIWRKRCFKSKKELLRFIDKVDRLMTGDVMILYLSATQRRVEKQVREKAFKLRARDSFFASSDILIRKSLEYLFPNLSPYTMYIRREEIEGGVPLSQLKKRYANFIIVSNGMVAYETLTDFKEKHTNYFFKEDQAPKQIGGGVILNGQTGNKGIIAGEVMVLKRINQIKNIPNGAIIVSPMTTPALVPGLKKAAAIVTDEGGILCHAAVISRELGIPCVIGTKIATKFFKDGDMVEVDAEKGIVRKIK